MNAKHLVSVILMIVLVAACGCTGTPSVTPPGTGTAAGTQAQQAGANLVPGPTDKVPDYNAVTVDVSEKEYNGIITVTFQGGMGQIHVKRIDVKMTKYDGTVQTATVDTKKGDFVELQGTRGEGSLRGQPDRVEVSVTMDNGQTYKVADVLREYRSRG